jgi:hypothetical protein
LHVVVALQLCEADRERVFARAGRKPLGELTEAPLHLVDMDPAERADELIATEARDQVIRAQSVSQSARNLAQQSVTGQVTLTVVDFLEVVHVDECEDEAIIGAARAVDLPLKIGQPDASDAGAGKRVGRRALAGADGCAALTRCLNPPTGGFFAVSRRPFAILRRAFAVAGCTRASSGSLPTEEGKIR